MSSLATILPGARVRAREGIIGTVERLEYLDVEGDQQPGDLVVRSDDGRWRYNLPVMLVSSVTQGTFYTVVSLTIGAGELTHYIAEEITSRAQSGEQVAPLPSGEWMPDEQDATLRIPLAAEEITTYKRPIELGSIHIHKGVETVEQHMTVPVYHEEAIVEHIPPDQYDGSVPASPNEVIIPIVEEQLVVEKRSVVKEYLRVRKNIVTEQQAVRDMVRHEFVEVTEGWRDGPGKAPLIRELPPGSDGAAVDS